MRIIVQHEGRKAYFDGADWTESAARAIAFETVARAEAFCREHALQTALIVVQSTAGRQDVSYPVGARNAVLVSKPPTTRISRVC